MPTDIEQPTLLLVEDSEDDALFFEWTLGKSGLKWTARHVTDGAQAIELLRQRAHSGSEVLPRILFLDLKMPVLNGFDVLKWLQTQPFASQIPVVVLSGSDIQSDKEQSHQLGATEYWVKPVRLIDLKRCLESVSPGTVAAPARSEAPV